MMYIKCWKKYALGASLVMALASCSKDDSPAPASGWSLGGRSFIAKRVVRDSVAANTLYATDGSSNAITLYFDNFPSSQGAVRIGNAFGQLTIVAGIYGNANTTSVDALFSVSNGKVTIDIPPVSMFATSRDSVQLTAHLVQQ